MMEKWLIVGARGALGSDLLAAFGDKAIPAYREDFNLNDKEAMYHFIKKQPIVGVINTAAFHQVPLCEDHEQQAFEINTLAVKKLSELCTYLKLHLCQISTDYVFDGSKYAPYNEKDLPNPLSTYANSKLAGEYMVQAYAKSFSIIRSCGLYGRIPTRAKGGNFITQIIKQAKEGQNLKVVDDEWVTPTCTYDLAEAIKILLIDQQEKKHQGIFHVNQSGKTTWFQFAKVILKVLGFKNNIESISRQSFVSPVQRPAFSILDISKFTAATGHSMLDWQDALSRFLKTHQKDLMAD